MSLNQLLLDEEKPYLNLRCYDLQVDGQLKLNADIEKVEVTLILTGAITGTADARFFRIGQLAFIELDDVNETATVSNNIFCAGVPADFIPDIANQSRATPAIVVDNGQERCGSFDFFGGELRFSSSNNNAEIGDFSGSGNTGWNRILVHYVI